MLSPKATLLDFSPRLAFYKSLESVMENRGLKPRHKLDGFILEGKEVGIEHCHDKDFGREGTVRLPR